MKKIITYLLFLLCNFTFAVNWITSLEDAKKIAISTDRFMIVDFWATWCGPCKKMDLDSWDDKNVAAILEAYVPVRINLDLNKEIAFKYSIQGVPSMFILDANGKIVHEFLGYQSASELYFELEKFALSTEYLTPNLIKQFRYPSFNSSIRVAQAYLDFSIITKAYIKLNFIKTSDIYLDDSKKYLDKKEDDYIEKKQKILLIQNFKMVYLYDFKKLKKEIKKIKEIEIAPNNIKYYLFLKYVIAKANKEDDYSFFEEKLKTLEDGDYFIQKANLILSKE